MASHSLQMGVGSGLRIMKRGSAAAHGGKPSAYRQAAVTNSGGSASARGIASEKKESRPESRNVSAMCCGKAANQIPGRPPLAHG
jgi:hypothetical protein